MNYPLVGNAVLKVDEFVEALERPSAGGAVAAGDEVIGSDRGKIGTVDDVQAQPAEGVPYMTVSTGVLGIGGKLHIPLEAVVQRSANQVFVNIPKLVAGKMPWHDPPSAQAYREKMGPAERSAAPIYGSTGPSGVV